MKYLMKLNCFTESKTYIKAFEDVKNGRKGDYVLLKYPENWGLFPYVKIIQKIGYSYQIEGFKRKDNKLNNIWVDYYDIDRRLKKSEIEEFESRKRAIIFNL